MTAPICYARTVVVAHQEIKMVHPGNWYTERDSKIGKWQGGAPVFESGEAGIDAAKPERLVMQIDLKFSGCPTMPRPIFESHTIIAR